MVVFSCDGCGEVLKKQQVDAHAARCRSCASVSCADCAVHFFGDDYRTHTTCMTEAERYEKSVYRGPSASSTATNSQKKQKRNPQEEWMDLIARAATAAASSSSSSSSGQQQQQQYQLLQTLASLGNVPRKEKQFRNFAMNSLNLRGGHANSKSSIALLDQVWALLNTMRNAENDVRKKQEAKEKEIHDERKRKEMKEREIGENEAIVKEISSDDDDDDDSKNDDAESVKKIMPIPSSKVVRKAVKKILKKEEKKCIKIKVLRSKLRDVLGIDKSLQKELKKLLQKELKAQDTKIKVDGKMVQLL
ncbi:hypothetical protein MHU86_19591 [Fragilaria crotonensis]|nr:hypothetical protein MHU86_19591 [Fragilaria crotonensis]